MPRSVDTPAAAAARGAGINSDYSPLKGLLNFQQIDDTALQAGGIFITVIQDAVGQVFGVISSLTGIDLSPFVSLFTGTALTGNTGTNTGTTVPGIDLSKYAGPLSVLSPTMLLNLVSSISGVIGVGNLGTVLPQLMTLVSGFTSGIPILSQLIGLIPGASSGLSGTAGLGSIFGDLTGLLGSPTALGSGAPTIPGLASIPILGPLLATGGTTLLGSLIPGLDASKIVSGTFGAGVLQPLIDAISSGFGGSSGLSLGGLQSLLGSIPGASELVAALISAVAGSGSGLTGISGITSVFSDLAGLLGHPTGVGTGSPALPGLSSIPILGPLLSGGNILGSLIPGLDASKIVSGTLGASILQPLIDAISGGFGGSSGLGFGGLTSMLGAIPGAGPVLDTIVSTFLGLTGSGFNTTDLTRALTSIPGDLISGTLNPGMASNLGVGMISNVVPELLTNPNFDTAASIIGQGVWTWDGTQGPGSLMTSIFTDAAGVLREVFSNVIHVSPGQVLNISANTAWGPGFSGGANSIALTVAQFSGNVLSSYSTIASIAAPGASSGWMPLSASYTVPAGIDSIFVRPVVTAAATAGRVRFGGMSVKPSSTNLLAGLVPLLDASKIGSGQFGIGQITNLPTLLGGLGTSSSIIDQLIAQIPGTTTGLTGLSGFGSVFTDMLGFIGGPTGLGSGVVSGFMPANNIAGVAGISGMGSTMQGTWDQLYTAFSMLTGSNQPLSALADSAHGTANTAADALNRSFANANIMNIRNNQPVHISLDPTGEASHILNLANTMTATATSAPMAFLRVGKSGNKGAFETLAQSSGTITSLTFNIFKMDPATGNLNKVYTTPDLHTQLGGASWAWITDLLSGANQLATMPGDTLAWEPIVVGSGTVTLPMAAVSGVPQLTRLAAGTNKHYAASRNPATLGAAPTSIAAGSVAYGGNQPWFQTAITNVPANFQPPDLQVFSTSGTWTKPAWLTPGCLIAVFVLGAGGGGGAGGYGAFNSGASAGSWSVRLFVYGSDPNGTGLPIFPSTTTTLTCTVGAAGAGGGNPFILQSGTPGGASSVAGAGITTITGAGGGAGGTSGSSGNTGGNGPSPQNEVLDGYTDFGGTAVGVNSSGSFPGGGGGSGYPASGYPGAGGEIRIRCRQP